MNLYQKYRPSSFNGLVAQEHVKSTLVNALLKDSLSHAYLFCGPRGTGKTSTARLLAKSINCKQRDNKTAEPCNKCMVCEQINQGSLVDLIEIDAASNRGVDEIRDLRESVKFAPTQAESKIYIIDEVHMLTKEAFNALLKTLEEPPKNVYFILATTELHKIPDTIVSRCQRFGFRRIVIEDISNHLASICKNEKIKAETDALNLIAKRSEGCMRDALSLLDQVSSFSDVTLDNLRSVLGSSASDLVISFVDNLISNNIADNMEIIQNLTKDGINLDEFSKEMLIELQEKLINNLKDERICNKITDISKEWMDIYNQFRVNNNLEFGLQVLCIECTKSKSNTGSNLNPQVNQSVDMDTFKLEVNQMISSKLKDLPEKNTSSKDDKKQDLNDLKIQLQIYLDEQLDEKISNIKISQANTSEEKISQNLKDAIKISDSLKVSEEEEETLSFEADINFKITDLRRSWKKIVKKSSIPKLVRLLNEATLEKVDEKLFLIYNATFFKEQMDTPEFIRATEKLLFEHGYAVNISLMLKKDWIKKSISSKTSSPSKTETTEAKKKSDKKIVKTIEPIIDSGIDREPGKISSNDEIPLPPEEGNSNIQSEEEDFVLEDFFDVED